MFEIGAQEWRRLASCRVCLTAVCSRNASEAEMAAKQKLICVKGEWQQERQMLIASSDILADLAIKLNKRKTGRW